MKKTHYQKLLFLLLMGCGSLYSQVGTSPPYTTPTSDLAQRAWFRGGNTNGGTATNANIFGTMWNSSIHTFTDGVFRMITNATVAEPNLFPTGGTINTSGFIGLGTKHPYSPIHIGEDLPAGVGQGGGYRPWMTQGLLTMFESDNLYIGMKDEGSDRSDAVIAWGDNPSGTTGSDNFRFIFASPASAGGVGNGINGVEIMHLNSFEQFVGVGPNFTNSRRPSRRFEVEDANAGNSNLTAQFRITQLNPLNNTVTDGTYSDFQVSNNGDLYIRPYNSAAATGQQNRNVGIGLNPIGTSAATEALDVNGNARVRNVLAQGGQSLILGLQQGTPT